MTFPTVERWSGSWILSRGYAIRIQSFSLLGRVMRKQIGMAYGSLTSRAGWRIRFLVTTSVFAILVLIVLWN